MTFMEADPASPHGDPSCPPGVTACDPGRLTLLIRAFLEGRSQFDGVEQAARALCANLVSCNTSAAGLETVLRDALREAASDAGMEWTSLPVKLVMWQIARWVARAFDRATASVSAGSSADAI